MKFILCGLFFLLCGMATAWGLPKPTNSVAVSVHAPLDPKSVSLFAIPETLRNLELEAARLRAKMALLPELEPVLQDNAFGYHGGYLPALDELPEEPRWTVDVRFLEKKAPMNQAILVPAIDRRFSKVQSYGFPRRFRVSQILPDGSTRVMKEWMNEDCPDPGRVPVVIDLPEPWQVHLRVEVFRGAMEEGKEFFALDEFFGIAKNEAYIAESVEVSQEYESLPYWSRHFLVDNRTSLGVPVAATRPDARVRLNDFAVEFESIPAAPCVLLLDLGKNHELGWVTLYPASPPEGMLIPGYGFPRKIELDILWEDQDKRRVPLELPRSKYEASPGNNAFQMAGYSRFGRWIRIKVSDFPEHNGRRVFSLGEILVGYKGKTYPVKQIRLEGFPEGAVQADWLIDLMSNGRPVMFLVEWMRELRHRDDLAKQLHQITALMEELAGRRAKFWEISRISLVSLFVLVALVVALAAVVFRIRSVRTLRWQITRDLHDDVGSTLGSISLAAEEIGRMSKDEEVKEELDELMLMSREAFVSLREVVWLTDKSIIRLPALLARMEERSERMLRGVELSVTRAEHCPDTVVSLAFKRHLIMFFREMVSNCARHARASHVRLVFLTDEGRLKISLEDDGCGFDPETVSGGWGLDSLKKRAKEMKGEMSLKSRPGEGTLIVLSVPLKSLSDNPGWAYKTSN